MNGVFYGIGVGPGDPELLTLKARRILGEVDVVYAPTSKAERSSTACGIVKEFLRADCQTIAAVFPMTKNRNELELHWDEATEAILQNLRGGQKVAFITLGDPTLYSTYGYVARRLKAAGAEIETIPGVTAVTAAAAALNLTLAEGDDSVAVLPSTENLGRLREALRNHDTVVLLKVAKNLPAVLALLEETSARFRTYLVSQVGQANERIITSLAHLNGAPLPYLTLLVITKGDGLE